jgi:Protein of unknown function (DUF3179)
VLNVALVVAGCGGGSEDSAASDKELDEVVERVDRELEKSGGAVGLGEASPPPADAGQWKTDFTKRLVPLAEFQAGGPPKDGIPAIDEPRYTRADDVEFLEDREPVILLTVDGESRAYPLQILTWHEIVNTRLGDTPVAVTFCPLCNTAIVFDRRVDGAELTFGTTGKLRDSDLVMYDRQTESWWQQFSGRALVGELAGTKLRQLSARIVSWAEFKQKHPSALVLNRDTGYARDYGTNPYAGYDDVDSPPYFASRNEDDDRLPPKERVVYVEVGKELFAVPYSALAAKRTIEIETTAGKLVVRWRRRLGPRRGCDRRGSRRRLGNRPARRPAPAVQRAVLVRRRGLPVGHRDHRLTAGPRRRIAPPSRRIERLTVSCFAWPRATRRSR